MTQHHVYWNKAKNYTKIAARVLWNSWTDKCKNFDQLFVETTCCKNDLPMEKVQN